MSSESKTIDNLGLEASVRWAKDQGAIDPKLISESRSVPLHTQVSSTEPYFGSQLEDLFAYDKKNISFAKFTAPKGYHSHQRALFTFQIIPAMGTMEKQEVNLTKLSSLKDESEIEEREEEAGSQEEKEPKSPELKEIDTVEKMLKKIGLLDKYLNVINSRRQQFHKG